jgi:hypothetical protein
VKVPFLGVGKSMRVTKSRVAWDFSPNGRYTSSKTKYGWETDSEQVLRRKGEKNFEKIVKRLETVGKEGIKIGYTVENVWRKGMAPKSTNRL